VIADEYSMSQLGNTHVNNPRDAATRGRTRADTEKGGDAYPYPVPSTQSTGKRPAEDGEGGGKKRSKAPAESKGEDGDGAQENAEVSQQGYQNSADAMDEDEGQGKAGPSGADNASPSNAADTKREGRASDAPPGTAGGVGSGPIKAPEEMSFCLRWDEENDIPGTRFHVLDKPYLRTSSAITVLHLKKYLTQKFELKADTAPLRFRCRGELLDDRLKVSEVYENIWKDPNVDLELHFCTTATGNHSVGSMLL